MIIQTNNYQTYDYRNVVFAKDRITIKDNGELITIFKKNIKIFFYAKWSIRNYFSLAYCPPVGMGFLYISQKIIVKTNNTLRIWFPFKELKKYRETILK